MKRMNTLYFTRQEQELFSALPESLKEGWTVKSVETLHEESSDELFFRLRMAKVQNYALKAVIDSLKKKSDLAEAVKHIDFTTFSSEAQGELFFLLGVRVLTAMILSVLAHAMSDEDLEGLAGLTYIRDSLSAVNAPSARL